MNKTWERRTAAYLASQAITLFGSSLVQFAIIWYIARETSSGLYVTLSILCAFVPQIIISLFAGVWADRYSRKLLIAFSDGGIAAFTLLLALVIMLGKVETLGAMLAISAIRSVGAGIQIPAVNALLPQLVPEDRLMKINGYNSGIQSVIHFASPAAAGAVLSFGKLHHILLIDVITAAIGIGVLLCIQVPPYEKKERTGGYLDELKKGLVYGWSNRLVRRILLLCGVYMILIVPCAFLNVLMVTRTFGDSYWYLTANEMVFFVGAAAGGLILGSWGGFKNRFATLSVGVAAFGLLTFLVGITYNFYVYLVLMALIGLSMPFGSTPVMTLLQERVEPGMQGRIFALYSMIASSLLPLGTAVFGPLADVMPIQYLMIGTGVATMLLPIALVADKAFYQEGIRTE